MPRRPRDLIKAEIFDGLVTAGIVFTQEGEPGHPDHRLDFDLPDHGIAIECKFDHTPRIADQLSRQRNIIVIQGLESAIFFSNMLIASKRSSD